MWEKEKREKFFILFYFQNFSSCPFLHTLFLHYYIHREQLNLKKNTMVIPAWKKLGLRVKETISHDPLALVQREDIIDSNNKSDLKNINKKKRKINESVIDKKESKESKREPKRVKLPKNERTSLPITAKDQLVYLSQFNNDKKSWKFSKQKQNWIIKNIKEIPEDSENDLMVYLKDIQGGSRQRIINDMLKVVNEWNELAKKAADELNNGTEIKESQENEETEESEKSKKNSNKKKKVEVKQPIVDFDYAERASKILLLLTNEKVDVIGTDNNESDEINKEKEEEEVSSSESSDSDSDSDSSSSSDSSSGSSSDSDSDSDSGSSESDLDVPPTVVEEVDANDYDSDDSNNSK